MKYNPEIHHRRSIRLKGYDYSQAGAYFITLCTQNREHLFGRIENGIMILNDAGRMVETVWNEIPQYYCGFYVHEKVVMPDHFHGIIEITEDETLFTGQIQGNDNEFSGHVQGHAPTNDNSSSGQVQGNDNESSGHAQGHAPTFKKMSLPDIVHRFKTLTTTKYIKGVKNSGWKSFPGKLWQRNYYEHIVRNESDFNRIQEYIRNNPLKWDYEKNNLSCHNNDICGDCSILED